MDSQTRTFLFLPRPPSDATGGKGYREEYREGGITGWFKSLFGHEHDEDRSPGMRTSAAAMLS